MKAQGQKAHPQHNGHGLSQRFQKFTNGVRHDTRLILHLIKTRPKR